MPKPTTKTQSKLREPIVIDGDNPHYEFFCSADRYKETIQFLMLLGHGEMLDNLQEKLVAMSKATETSSKKSSFTLKVLCLPDVGARRQLKYEIKTSIPEEDTSDTTAWVTPQHQFVQSDPRQLEMDLKVVGQITREIKDAGATVRVIKDAAGSGS